MTNFFAIHNIIQKSILSSGEVIPMDRCYTLGGLFWICALLTFVGLLTTRKDSALCGF